MLQEVERVSLQLLGRLGWDSLAGKRILDCGCGEGYWLRRMLDWGAMPDDLFGIDALPERIAGAVSKLPINCKLQAGDALQLPWPDEHFDMVSQFVVFSSILSPDLRGRLAAEIRRVLRPGGCILWYDFFRDNPRNPDVVGISRGELAQLFPGLHSEVRRTTLAPPIARWLGQRSRWSLAAFSGIGLLRTHFVAVIRKI
jgi:SAM-dependent methyltransferase